MKKGSSVAESYRHWLANQIANGNPGKTYRDLTALMFEKPFEWLVPNDDNRVMDGLELRTEFRYAEHIRERALKSIGPANFLEVLVALSRRLAFMGGGDAPGWAWHLMDNLGLRRMYDPLPPRKALQVIDILDTCIWRTYEPDGQGGFFPLSRPKEDQTKVEIWYQIPDYLEELNLESH